MNTCQQHDKSLNMHEVCRFLTEYAACLLACGATCTRITRNVSRMADVAGVEADIIILPSHMSITLSDPRDGRTFHHTSSLAHVPVSFNINTQLSKLSWKVAEGRVDFAEARRLFERIKTAPRINQWYLALLVSAANASFCRLFGGDPMAMAIVAAATMAGYSLKLVMLGRHADIKLVVIACAFLSALISCVGYAIGCTSTPDIAVGTSVLYLIPGIPYINSVSDLLSSHYLSGYSRLANALVLTGCIALGMTVAVMLMNIQILS
ncbi:MAG: threonine/serine exporter family protein [Muribaculaceae bacterium]|nr:threonine/serine exporter family protein [Muribaculaceae bacterium]